MSSSSGSVNGYTRRADAMDCHDSDMPSHPSKKMRVSADLAASSNVAVAQLQ